ncbi:hypothetical protein VSU19_19830 [Verrucomicrobiales bacterium BCK34]|nr:hypothetical protein [Verrucomicrobiales bacterium BCK34]
MESVEAAREEFRARLPVLKEEINELISSITGVLRATNPLELLSRVSFNNLVASETETGAGNRSEAKPEFFLSLALAQKFPETPVVPSPEQIQECFDQIDELFVKATVFYGGNKVIQGAPDDPESELLSDLVVNTLNVRGDGFYHHMKNRFEKVIEPHHDFFTSHFGFALRDYHEFLDRIEKEMNRKIEEDRKEKIYPLQQLFSKIDAEIATIEEPKEQEYHRTSYSAEIAQGMALFNTVAPPEVFRVEPLNKIEKNILRALSCQFGDNDGFLSKIPKWQGWPLNPTIIDSKPFVEHDGQYYLFHLQKAGRSAFQFFDSLADSVNLDYRNHKILKSRDDFTESEAVGLFARALPGSKVFKGLEYSFSEGGESREGEVDGIVVYDNNLIVIEAKAHGMSASARRGGPDRLVSDLKKSLDASHYQASRLLEALDAQGKLELRDDSGKAIYELVKSDFVRRFMVSVSFDLLPIVGASLPTLRKMGLISGNDWPWAVSLDDLRVAVDLLDRPSVFLHFLLRRSRLNEFPKVHASDELDYLAHYIHKGLFFEDESKYADYDDVSILDHTQDVVQYYRRAEGSAGYGKKPKVPLSGSVKRFLEIMEKHQPPNFSSATLGLLEFDIPERNKLLGSMNKQIKKLRQEYRGVFASLKGDDRVPALVISILPSLEGWTGWAEERCFELLEKYEIKQCTLVMLTLPIAAGVCEIRVLQNEVQ